MEFNYLKEIRNIYESSTFLLEIVFILGNNTCDMDSALSSYLLSIGKNIKNGAISLSKKGKPSINTETKIIYLPVLNVKRGTLPHRIDVKYIFDTFGIDENDFWYISDEIFDKTKLFQYKNNQNNIKTSLIIVDHTILIEEQNYLSEYVIGIYDHHLLSNYNGQYKNLQTYDIKYPVGSCTTLILSDYFDNEDEFPIKLVSPLMAVTAILIDTKKFDNDFYGNRWVDLDKKIYKKIKKFIKDEDKDIKMKKYYKEVKDIKHDLEKNLNLGFEPLLSKDQKFFNWDKRKAVWSSLPISFNEIKKKFGDKKIVNHYMDYYKGKTKEEQKNTFFITNSSLGNKKKLFTIFNPFKIPFKKNEIENELVKNSDKEFYSVDINNIGDENEENKGEVCHIVVGDTYSRKSFEPVLKSFFSKLNPDSDISCDENK